MTSPKTRGAACAGSRPRASRRAGVGANVVSLAAFRVSRAPAASTPEEIVSLVAAVSSAKSRADVLRQLAVEVRGEIQTARLGLGERQQSPARAAAQTAFLAELEARCTAAARLFEEREEQLVTALGHAGRERRPLERD